MAVVIKDLLPKPVSVSVGDQEVPVRGLYFDDMTGLIEKHKDELVAFFAKQDELDAAAMMLKAPKLVAEIVAIGMDAEGQEDDVRKLPVGVQIEALTQIWQLTVPDLKKLRKSLLEVVATLSQLNQGSVETSPSTKPSEDTSQNS